MSSDPKRHFDLSKGERLSKVDFQVEINKKTLLKDDQFGFNCEICKLVYKDNLSFLEHLSSAIHMKNAGISNRVERSTLAQVKARLEARRNRPVQKDPKLVIEENRKKEEQERLEKKLEKKAKKQILQQVDDEVMQSMGFGGFK